MVNNLVFFFGGGGENSALKGLIDTKNIYKKREFK